MDLRLIREFNESHQYRSKPQIRQTNARVVADFAFMDLIALWILYNEFEYAPKARKYAAKTVTFNGFRNYRQMGTDLYINLHILTQKRSDLLDSSADSTLFGRLKIDERLIIRYLREIEQNSLNQGTARRVLHSLDDDLYITDSNYRSVRRLAQNWRNLTSAQKRTVVTRMLFFYKAHARRSEIYGMLRELGKKKSYIAPGADNPEIGGIGLVGGSIAALVAAKYLKDRKKRRRRR